MALLDFHTSPFFFHIYLLLSLIIFQTSSTADQLSYFINCGSSGTVNIDNDGRTFVPDEHPQQFRLSSHGSNPLNNNKLSSDPLCQTARVFTKPSHYDFDIPNSIGTYILRFHFCNFSSQPELANAQFNVSAAGHMLLPRFSLGNETTDSTRLVKEFFLTINSTTGKLKVYIEPTHSLAFINALEVLSTNQNIQEANITHVTPSGNTTTYNGLKSMVLETIHRIKFGGTNVTGDNYYRTWISGDPYLVNHEAASNSPSHNSEIIRYVTGAATADDAPDDVYRTATILNANYSGSNPNPTWHFKVSKGATFFVRVHFYDITGANGPYAFNFYIFTKFVELIFPFEIFNQSAVPFYNDYMVGSDDLEALSISIGYIDDKVNKTHTFINGLEILQVKNGTAWGPPDDNSASHVALIVGLVGASVVLLATIVVLAWKKRQTKPLEEKSFEWAMVPWNQGTSSPIKTPDKLSSHSSNLSNLHLCLKIPLVEIQQVTKNFNENLIIGEGGFGKVYIGTLTHGRKVAVKRSNPDHGQGLLEFQAEIMVLSKIRHLHLVSLIGYCNEEREMILIYEFMEKGTLRDHLYGSKKSSVLSWKQRLEICIGAAKGLHYLHTGTDRVVIHRDVKSTNILLDENYVAKVADFGLSRSGHREETHISTDVKGTFGYLDPEYYAGLQLTEKSDVYSFGVVLLEVLCARPVIDRSLPIEQINLADWGTTCHEQGQLEKIIDPLLVGDINRNSLKKFAETVVKCLKENAGERPSMSDVRWNLEYVLQLQETATRGELLQDDSMADASFNLPQMMIQRFPSQSLAGEEDDIQLMDTSSSAVFSQLRFDNDNFR